MQVSELEDLADKLRMKAKKDPELTETSKQCHGKVQALKGDDGVKDKYLDFIAMVEEQLAFLNTQTKDQVVINTLISRAWNHPFCVRCSHITFMPLKVDYEQIRDTTSKVFDWDKALTVHADNCKTWISSKKGLVN